MRKMSLFQIRKRVVFKYEKCSLNVFSNMNVSYIFNKRHAIFSDQISFSGSLYFVRYWAICVLVTL